MKKMVTIFGMVGVFALISSLAEARPCSECNALSGGAYSNCMATCDDGPVTDCPEGQKKCRGRCIPNDAVCGGTVDWCARLETCKTALTALIPDCSEDVLPFTGETENCKAEAKLCKVLSKESVAKTMNAVCASGECAECAECAECEEGCKEGEACMLTTCKPICTEDALKLIPPKQIAALSAEKPFWEEIWFWILVALGVANVVVVVLRTRKPKGNTKKK